MRRLLAVVLAALMALGAVPAMAAATDAALTFVVADEVTGTDIQMITWENLVHALIYAPLVLMDETNTSLTPNMVSAVTVENDGKDIVFTIPEGICFSNGDPVTAEAVAANFERYRNVSVYASDLDPVTSIETAGDKVIFHCDKAAPYLGAMLVSSYSGVDNVAAIAEGGDDAFNLSAVTYGPYSVSEWTQGQQIVLTRNENYKSFNPSSTNKGPVYPAQITIRFISDDYTRVNELLSGSVDYIDAVPAANLSELQSAPGVVLAHTMQPGCDFLLLNTKDPILADYNVRLAIAKGINRQELCAAQDDTIIPADGFLTPAQIGYSAESAASLAEKYAYDPEGAKKLLADAGWADSDGDGILDKDGTKLSFEYLVATDYTAMKNAAPVIQYQLKQIGVDMVVSELEGSAIKAKALEGNYQTAMRKYAWADADMLTNLFGTSSGYYSDATLDQLLEEGRYITDGAERAAKYAQAQDVIFEQLPGIPLFYELQYSAYSDKLQGIRFSSTGNFIADDLYKAE